MPRNRTVCCWAILLLLPGAGPSRATAAEPPPDAASSRSPYLPTTGKAQVSLFGVRAEGYKFVFVLDRSNSMGGSSGKALAAAKAELLAGIEKLDTVHQFQIVFYNERPRLFNPTGEPSRLAFGNERNKAEARKFITSIEAEGGTAHEDALLLAIRLRPDVIFLLTDADDPKLTARQLARLERIGAGVILHTIEFGTGPQRFPHNFLEKLAQQSGGEHTYVDVTRLGQAAAKDRKDE